MPHPKGETHRGITLEESKGTTSTHDTIWGAGVWGAREWEAVSYRGIKLSGGEKTTTLQHSSSLPVGGAPSRRLQTKGAGRDEQCAR